MKRDLINKLSVFFKNHGNIGAVLIFGSEAQNKATSFSDIDIAVLCDPDKLLLPEEQMEMRENLVSLLKKEVDLVVLNQANPILKHQIYKNGKIVFNKNPHFYNRFFVRSLNEYDDLKKIRAPIEKNLLKRKIYG